MWPVKKLELWGAGMVICLEQGADLHMAQRIPLPLTVSCFSKIQIGFTFLVPAHPGSPVKRAVKRVCVCVWISMEMLKLYEVIATVVICMRLRCSDWDTFFATFRTVSSDTVRCTVPWWQLNFFLVFGLSPLTLWTNCSFYICCLVAKFEHSRKFWRLVVVCVILWIGTAKLAA